jgi:asparagine synthase (glutamine-hydrolysing)
MHDLGIRKIKTYSIGFQNEKNETSNEFYFSDIIAKKFKTDHRKIVMSEDDFYDSLDEWIEAMGEPIGAPAAVSLFWLSRIASREVKVILNGQGADENFGGYEWYKIMRKMFDFDHAPSQFLEYYAGIKEFEKNRLLNDSFRRYDVSLRKVKEVYKSYVNSGQRDGLSATCHLDFHFGLPEVGLKEVDAVSMHFGLESRVPYLDCDLVNFCCMLPENLKIRALNEKYILKKANRKKLPEEILGRKKLGFPVPVATWYQAKMGKMIKETLLSKHSLARGIFNEEELRKFLYQEERSSDCSRNKTFRFFVLELWMRRFMDS